VKVGRWVADPQPRYARNTQAVIGARIGIATMKYFINLPKKCLHGELSYVTAKKPPDLRVSFNKER
jgi:hypothetical protein